MNTLNRYNQVLLFILSNLGWFACVYSSYYQLEAYTYIVPILFFLFIRLHHTFYFVDYFKHVLIALVGITFDCIAISNGWVRLKEVQPLIISHWLVALWFLFSLSMPMYVQWLNHKWIKAAVLGLIAGPLTYKSGEAIGVLYLASTQNLIYYAAFWSVFFPASIWFLAKGKK